MPVRRRVRGSCQSSVSSCRPTDQRRHVSRASSFPPARPIGDLGDTPKPPASGGIACLNERGIRPGRSFSEADRLLRAPDERVMAVEGSAIDSAIWRKWANQSPRGAWLRVSLGSGDQHFVMCWLVAVWSRVNRMVDWGKGVEDKRAIFDRGGGWNPGAGARPGTVWLPEPARREPKQAPKRPGL